MIHFRNVSKHFKTQNHKKVSATNTPPFLL